MNPDNLVVFYPTRYDIDSVASRIACPVAAFFAEYDVLPGATVEDAHALREKLLCNEKVICPHISPFLSTYSSCEYSSQPSLY